MWKNVLFSIGGAAVAALATAFIQHPINYDFIPLVMERLHAHQAIMICPIDPQNPTQFSCEKLQMAEVYRSSLSDKNVAGRMIQRGKTTTMQWYISGFAGHDLVSFSFYPVADDHRSGGAFIGRQITTADHDGVPTYVGTLVGWDKEKDDEQECTLRTFIAVLGPEGDATGFPVIAANFVKAHPNTLMRAAFDTGDKASCTSPNSAAVKNAAN